jgi:hypothetical protein
MPGRQEVPTFLESVNGAKVIIFNNISNPLRSPRPLSGPRPAKRLPFIHGPCWGLETTRHWILDANFTERLGVLQSRLAHACRRLTAGLGQ